MAPTAIDPAVVRRARVLRRNMTEGERKLWSDLREFRRLYGLHVRGQVPISPYIVDFVLHEKGVVIEVDGEHHFTSERMEKDRTRDAWLGQQGYRVLRFSTGELAESFDGCVEEILREVGVM
ncbi:MAG: endonuclease domain-containing protein [Mesorhizobium sp.]|uniref:endonuclease domain-containing protein n=1 Tax=Mesorhizobium sp. TaxID=1871066 RepID=UPI000FEA5AFE|nr:endonuclease domain-containing protein [Mesorhizobium sp.]RWM11589.1 MAG: endonuclease domain-containing protein [Mesorhizobium sp.]TIO53163.1 MAG: endonuclease domain-containing protein [Mesorhizobium sp.]TIO62129.1 MAG: endonuclease domain-containing protein [Mesorhizobium sp.]TJV66872.1 MAG: endonuclease domain-containing protein [Mesorhizobium sp.]